MEQGDVEKAVIEACVRARQPLPSAIANAPQLFDGLELYYLAFIDLSTDRGIGFGEGPIPWTSIDRYCARLGLEGEEREDFHHYVRAMDKTFLAFRAKKSKDESNATK